MASGQGLLFFQVNVPTRFEGESVQALQFYADKEDKMNAMEKLEELLSGEYNKDQILTCPLMKFSVKPGEVSGKYEETTHRRYRQRQHGFTENIEIQDRVKYWDP